jgi:DNA gyrase/topoisomerase IV subunit A
MQPGTYLNHDTDEISYSDFINKELILFSMADNIRSIPSVADGLKPGQRKVIWACFKRKLKKEIKVGLVACRVPCRLIPRHFCPPPTGRPTRRIYL